MAPRDNPLKSNRLADAPSLAELHAKIDRDIADDRMEQLTGKRPYRFKMPGWDIVGPIMIIAGVIGLFAILLSVLPCGG